MAAYFLDSSALVKRYVHETGTGWVRAVVDPAAGNEIMILRITGVEVISALVRRHRAGSISANQLVAVLGRFRIDLVNDLIVLEVAPALLNMAMGSAEMHGLRAYDAVQLAAVLEIHNDRITQGLPPITLVSSDLELNAAASAE